MDLGDDTRQMPHSQQMELSHPTVSTPASAPDEDALDSNTENSSDYTSVNLEQTFRRLGHETAGKCLGPMPVGGAEHDQNFLDKLIPLPSEVIATMPMFPYNAFRSVPEQVDVEQDLYDSIVDAFNRNSSIFRAVRTDEIAEDGSSTGSSNPGITIYPDGPDEAYTRDNKHFANFALAEQFIEVKRSSGDDCFSDDQSDLINFKYSLNQSHPKSTEKLETLGRSTYYATRIFSHQHRQCVFSIMIFGLSVRLLRWDRAGVLVTRAFDLHKEPQLLCEFIWRIERADLETRGYDASVARDNDPDHKIQFETIVKERLQFELGIDSIDAGKAMNRHYDPQNLSLASVAGVDGKMRYYCISKPTYTPLSPTGRSTRGYLAYGPDSKQVRFVKDTWRKNVEGMELEGDITQNLFNAGVRYVPEIECHGKVPRSTLGYEWQETITQSFISANWVRRSLSEDELKRLIVGHIHYRMVSITVGCGLSDHANAKELLCAARDIFDAVEDAYMLCSRLHRDISANNVILVRDRTTRKRSARLIDWEFSVTIDKLVNCHRISGTWQFISHRLLQGKDKSPHRLGDDIESIFWVTHWHLLIYYADLPPEEVGLELRKVFDYSEIRMGRFVGGEWKQFRLMDSDNLLIGFRPYPAIKEWVVQYADRLLSLRTSYPGSEQIPSYLQTLRSTVFDLADKVPHTILKKTPNWEVLKTYRCPELSLSEPATFSVAATRGLGMRTVSCGTIPPPSFIGTQGAVVNEAAGGSGSGGVIIQQTGGRVCDENSDGESRGAKRPRTGQPSSSK